MPRPTERQILNALSIATMYNHATYPVGQAAMAVMGVINDAWDADEAERERRSRALALVATYARHKVTCTALLGGYPCDCGYKEAIAGLREEPATEDAAAVPRDVRDAESDLRATISRNTADLAGASPLASLFTETAATPEVQAQDRAGWEYAENEPIEEHNREQVVRRAAYVEGVMASNLLPEASSTGLWLRDVRASAARRYPLKKRVPATKDDPHGVGFWRFGDAGVMTYSGAAVRSEAMAWSRTCPPLTPARVRALSELLDNLWSFEDDTSVEGEAA